MVTRASLRLRREPRISSLSRVVKPVPVSNEST